MSSRNVLPYSAPDALGVYFLKALHALASAWYGRCGDALDEAQRRSLHDLLGKALPGDLHRRQYKDLPPVPGYPAVDANDAKAVYASVKGAMVELIY